MTFEGTMENIVLAFEAVGVAIIAIGGVVALISGIRDFGHFERFFVDVRRGFGRPLILGLEVLVAADVIKTITVDPSLESVSVLGILVAVRIALEFLARHRGRRHGAVASSGDARCCSRCPVRRPDRLISTRALAARRRRPPQPCIFTIMCSSTWVCST